MREILPDKDAKKEQGAGSRAGSDNDPGIVFPVFGDRSANEECRNQKRDTLEVPGSNPELGGKISTISGKDTHPSVREGMDQINAPDEEERNSYDKEKCIMDLPAGVPDDDEDGECNRDTGEFNDPMKEDVVLEADEVQNNQD